MHCNQCDYSMGVGSLTFQMIHSTGDSAIILLLFVIMWLTAVYNVLLGLQIMKLLY